MPLHRETLLTLPSAERCISAITSMNAAFKAAHKRNAAAELFYSMVFSTDVERLNEPDTHLVTLQVDETEGGSSNPEIQWFRDASAVYAAVQ